MIRRRTLLAAAAAAAIQAKAAPCRLIAHRGVHSERIAENSAGAIEEAIRRGYWMVELDLRQTADGEIVIIHDRNLKRVADLNTEIASVPWSQLREVRLQPGNERLLRLREAAELARGRIQIWIDTKDASVTPAFLEQVESTLKENRLHEEAIIGIHEQATPFFQGRIRTARTIQDLFFQHRNRVDIARHSVLCEGIGFTLSNESVKWALERGVPVVPFVGLWHYPDGQVRQKGDAVLRRLLAAGVDRFMIDPIFEPVLRNGKTK